MFRPSTNFFLLLLLVFLNACKEQEPNITADLCDKSDVFSPKLVSVNDAHELLKSNSLLIPIEVSKLKEYQSGHIPKALNVWRPDFRSKVFSSYSGMLCSKDELELFLQDLGITNESRLLIYDNKGGSDAMRLAWVLDNYGVRTYQVINGGKAAWIQAGFLLDTFNISPIQNLDFKISTNKDSTLCADIYEVIAGLKDPNTIIVDTREAYEYLGAPFITKMGIIPYKKGAYDRGCIPGAVHLNWSELSDLSNDHRIKCPKDLIYNLEQKGITKDKSIIVYCQSGTRSSHTAFVLREILKYPKVKNYDGSWIEWSYYHTKGNHVPISKLTSHKRFEEIELELAKKVKNAEIE